MQSVRKTDFSHVEVRDTELSAREFDVIASLVYDRTGIVLGPGKQHMVFSRLVRRLRACGLSHFQDYCDLLEGPGGEAEMGAFINAMTTNLTRFFRESHHFDFLGNTVLAQLAARGERRLRIWSAGCSSGEEPYSIAMTLNERLPAIGGWDARILATDIDTNMVERGRTGVYSADAVSDMPQALRERYFTATSSDRFAVRDSLRQRITFNALNLLEDWPMKGPFDVIFCRNVMIYFDTPTKTDLVRRFARYLKPGGWLIVGHSETLLEQQSLYRLRGRTIYQLAERAGNGL